MPTVLKVNEIFLSIQGESTRAGLPCAFVRLAGCNLRCDWCDTAYAFDQGTEMTAEDVLARLADLKCKRVEITGGEPMLQTGTAQLLARLCELGYETLLETNGSIDLSTLDGRVVKIMDIKCPSSGQAQMTHWPNLNTLTASDELKFVLADRADFDYAKDVISRHGLIGRCPIIFSPVTQRLSPATLAKWILDDRLDVRLGLQLHKIIWPGAERGV